MVDGETLKRIERKVDQVITVLQGDEEWRTKGLVQRVEELEAADKARQEQVAALGRRMDTWANRVAAFASGLGAGSGGVVAYLVQLFK